VIRPVIQTGATIMNRGYSDSAARVRSHSAAHELVGDLPLRLWLGVLWSA
jgi:hypothetical protein